MKKLYVIPMVLWAVWSCSKSDDTSSMYSATIVQNFIDPLKNERNIQVEDYIPYTITIEDSQKDENVEYRLTSIWEGKPFHQTIWKDFGLHLTGDDKTPPDTDKKYISFYKRGTHSFYIRPYVPGTFKHLYELQKYVNGKAVGNAIKLNVNFNAVKIEVGKSEIYKEKNYIIFRKKEKIENYYFKINDGDEETDTYLSSNSNLEQNYILTTNKGDRSEGRFNPNQMNRFLEKNNDTSGLGKGIKQIKIIQQFSDLSEYIIEYHNIKTDL
ncbi:hypothetical protein [Capnocytophaga catalasegens]|nr:hypothetical protein [Capnocytophaga catalasegens]